MRFVWWTKPAPKRDRDGNEHSRVAKNRLRHVWSGSALRRGWLGKLRFFFAMPGSPATQLNASLKVANRAPFARRASMAVAIPAAVPLPGLLKCPMQMEPGPAA